MSIRKQFLTAARIVIHVTDETDLDTIVEPILERFPRGTLSDVRENTRDSFEGGKHVFVC